MMKNVTNAMMRHPIVQMGISVLENDVFHYNVVLLYMIVQQIQNVHKEAVCNLPNNVKPTRIAAKLGKCVYGDVVLTSVSTIIFAIARRTVTVQKSITVNLKTANISKNADLIILANKV